MKKLILSLLLLTPSISFADTATTGNPKLILISTGSVDRTRSWGDKVNENFSIISASMATLIAGGTGGGAQSSWAGGKATSPIEMGGYAINNSTSFTLGTGGKIVFPDGTTMITAAVGGGGGGGSLKVVVDSGTVFTTVSTINVTHADFASAFTAATWTVRLSSNVARRDSDQIFFGSNTFLNNLTISTGNLTLVPPYPVLGIGTGFYGNPSGIRTMLESRANYTQGFVENAIRNPSTTDGTGVAYRLSNDDINAVSSRYGLTASLNSAFPSVAFIQHPTNGLHIGNSAPTAGGSPVFVKSYVNQSNVSMVGIGTAAPQSLIHIVSTPGSVIPLVIVSSASNVSFSGRLFEIDRSSIQMNIPVYVSSITSLGTITGIHRGDGSGLTGISAVADQSSTYTWTGTHNYKGRISMQNATPIDDLTVTPNLYSLTFSPTPANGVQPAMYGFAINTGNIPAFVGHTIGVLGRSSDTENGHSYQFGVEGRADAYGDSTYRGVLGYTFGNFHRITGSTATLYALEARSEVFDADGVTPKSTATVVSVYIPAIVGGASDRKWSIYQSGLTDPAYFGSPVGIGVQRPFGTGTKLHIGDASNPTMIIADTDNGVSFSLGASGAAGGYTFVISTTSHPLLFGVNNSEAFRVDTVKNIGINTTAPTQKLSVVGTVDVSSMMVYGTVTSTSGFVAGSTSTFNAAIIKKRVITVTDATSITPDALIADIVHQVNTQAAGTLTINNPSGTSNDGQSLLIRVKCTNAQTLSWGAAFRGGTTALPTATTGSSKYDYYSFIRNGLDSTWDFTGKAEGF